MKAFTLILFLSVQLFSQIKHTDTDFYIEDKKTYWQHVFEAPEKIKEDLNTYANQIFSRSRLHSSLVTDENSISFTTDGELLNYKKFGGREMTTPMILRGEMSYRVYIEIQDYKYRITIKEIYFRNQSQQLLNSSLDECVTNKDKFKTSKGVSETLKYCELHFLDKFEFTKKSNPKW